MVARLRGTESALFVLGVLLMLTGSLKTVAAQEKEVLGWAERVYIPSVDITLHGKLDTGADFSSLHADDLKIIKKGDKTWARFKVTSRKGEEVEVEREVVRTTRIKRLHGKAEERPVISLGLCVGSNFQEEEVNLVNREKFHYNLLIGRSFLAGNAIVDPSTVYAGNPSCTKPKHLKEGLYRGEKKSSKATSDTGKENTKEKP